MDRRVYIYGFGYESPVEFATNRDSGTDFESSALFRIRAESEQSALAWGEQLSEWFVALLFKDPAKSWKAEAFARWIEQTPDQATTDAASKLEPVDVGKYPDFLVVAAAFGY